MCIENQLGCDPELLRHAEGPEYICGQMALMAAAQILESGLVKYQDNDPDPREVVFVGLTSGNAKIEAYTIEACKRAIGRSTVLAQIQPLAMSA